MGDYFNPLGYTRLQGIVNRQVIRNARYKFRVGTARLRENPHFQAAEDLSTLNTIYTGTALIANTLRNSMEPAAQQNNVVDAQSLDTNSTMPPTKRMKETEEEPTVRRSRLSLGPYRSRQPAGPSWLAAGRKISSRFKKRRRLTKKKKKSKKWQRNKR